MPRFAISALLTVLLVLSTSAFTIDEAETIHITVTNIRNDQGEIRLGFYTNDADFKADNRYLLKVFPKEDVVNGVLSVDMTLPPGTYGIAMLDDENGNGQMDFGWVLPEEGFGFSNYEHSGLTKPDFDDFKFDVKDAASSVSIKVRYM